MSEVKPGQGKHKVVGQVAVVRTLDGSERYVYAGAVFDAAQADAASVKHLVDVGLVKKLPASGPTAAEKAAAAAKKAADDKATADAAAAAKAEAEAKAASEKAAAEKAAAAKAK